MSESKPNTCTVEACENQLYCRSVCKKHYQQAYKAHCSIEGCNRSQGPKGWCQMHYMRWYRHGDVNRAPLTIEQRFWPRVDKADGPISSAMNSRCWVWQGAKNLKGYGHVLYKGRNTGAHRVAYMLSVGPIRDGLQIDHLCRTPACVNPEHLEPVTPLENTRRGIAHRERQAKSSPK